MSHHTDIVKTVVHTDVIERPVVRHHVDVVEDVHVDVVDVHEIRRGYDARIEHLEIRIREHVDTIHHHEEELVSWKSKCHRLEEEVRHQKVTPPPFTFQYSPFHIGQDLLA